MLFFALACATVTDAAWVNRNLLHEFLARPPVAPVGQPTLDAARIEACLHSAQDLDRLGGLLDQQTIVIQDTASRVAYSRSLEDRPQLPRPDRSEKQMRAQYDEGTAELAELQKLLDRDTKVYRVQFARFSDGIKAYERDCTGSFRKDDLDAARARLNMRHD